MIGRNKLKMIKNFKVRPKSIKLPEENTDSMFFDIGLKVIFFFVYVSSGKENEQRLRSN